MGRHPGGPARRAEIYATAGSEEEMQRLHSALGVPQNRIFASEDASLRSDILRETGGQGVDVVLCCLEGELARVSRDVVAEFGRYVSIVDDSFGGLAKQNRSFHAVAWARLLEERPTVIRR